MKARGLRGKEVLIDKQTGEKSKSYFVLAVNGHDELPGGMFTRSDSYILFAD